MKKLALIALIGSVASLAVADIQSPPADKNGPFRKLSRALANLVYGTTEIPFIWTRSLDTDGSSTAATYAATKGLEKSVVRVGYGLYELFTFPAPTYKGTYGSPYYKKAHMAPTLGYQEFPPQLGYVAEAGYSRGQNW